MEIEQLQLKYYCVVGDYRNCALCPGINQHGTANALLIHRVHHEHLIQVVLDSDCRVMIVPKSVAFLVRQLLGPVQALALDMMDQFDIFRVRLLLCSVK